VYTRKGEYDAAISEAQKGVTLDPGSSWAIFRYAQILNIVGRPEEATPLFEKAIRLNPLGPALFYNDYGIALRDVGRIEEAIIALKKAVERAPNYLWAHLNLLAAYMMIGREQEGHAEAAEVLRINPGFSIEQFARTTVIKDRKRVETIAQALRKAGLPDKSTSNQP
jgi:tetratricopeptide (TPR) repeat protein